MKRARVMQYWLIERIGEGRDYSKGSRVVYTGPLRNKPKGWRVVKRVA